MSELRPLGIIAPMAIAHKTGFLKLEAPRYGVHECVVGQYVHDIGKEHMMTSELKNAADPAFKGNRTFLDSRAFHCNTGHGMESGQLPLIVDFIARPHAAEIGSTRHG